MVRAGRAVSGGVSAARYTSHHRRRLTAQTSEARLPSWAAMASRIGGSRMIIVRLLAPHNLLTLFRAPATVAPPMLAIRSPMLRRQSGRTTVRRRKLRLSRPTRRATGGGRDHSSFRRPAGCTRTDQRNGRWVSGAPRASMRTSGSTGSDAVSPSTSSPSHRAITAAATELPTTLVALRPMSRK